MIEIFVILFLGAVIGYAFRGAIGKEVAKLGAELKAEIAKLKPEIKL